MNTRIIMLAVTIMVAAMIVGCSGARREAPDTLSEKGEVRVYEVFGMDCPGCHGGLEKLVLKIPSISAAEADWKEQRLVIVVESGSRLDDELVYDAVRRANFTPGARLR